MTTTTDADGIGALGLGALGLWMTLHDSAFPAGRLVHSNGIESWLRAHPDADADAITTLALDYVTASIATLDAVFAAHAWRARPTAAGPDLDRLVDLDRMLLTHKTSAIARDASLQPGRQLATTARRVGLAGTAAPYLESVIGQAAPGNLAVVEGAICAAIGVDLPVTVLGTLRSALAAALSAGVRLGRLGAMSSQRCLVAATPTLTELVDDVLATDLDDVATGTVALETWAMRHTRYAPRLFAT